MGYSKAFVAALEFVWGEGFLSPGGPEEVDALVSGHDLRGRRILDVGSGLGGISLLLAETYGARDVVGIDVNADAVSLARALTERRGLADRVTFQCVTPGPLPFSDQSFDVVFSKDAMVHVADKATLYAEIKRVLRSGGWLLASDWLWMPDAANNPLVKSYVRDNPLGFVFTTVAGAQAALEATGFQDISLRDRHQVIAARNRAETARLEGSAMDDLIAIVGEEIAADRLRSSRARQPVLDAAALIPTHITARKPQPLG
jgi:ubiquinone/menaquinone biosynthesis C-methylase UbiE